MKKAEKVLAGIAAAGLIFGIQQWPGGTLLSVLALSSLACLYYPFGALVFNGIRMKDLSKKSAYAGVPTFRIAVGFGIGMVLSVLVMGILFKWQLWPGGEFILIVGLIAAAGLLIALIAGATGNSAMRPFAAKAGARLSVWGSLALLLWLTPQITLVEWRHADEPELVEAWRAHLANPEDEALRRALDEAYSLKYERNSSETERDEQSE